MTEGSLLLRRRRALNKRLAALHLVGQRRFVDLDHDRIGIDAEVLHQRLGDVAHLAGLVVVGAACGHSHGNRRHPRLLVLFFSSWPGLSRPSTISSIKQDVDARYKAGHDAGMNSYPHFTSWRARTFWTSATRSASSTMYWASVCFFRYSSRSFMSVMPAPQNKSLILIFSIACSSLARMIAHSG